MQSPRKWIAAVAGALVLLGVVVLLRPAKQERMPEVERETRVLRPTRPSPRGGELSAPAGVRKGRRAEMQDGERSESAQATADGQEDFAALNEHIDVPSVAGLPTAARARPGARMSLSFAGSLSGSGEDGSSMEPILAKGLEFDEASGATRFGPQAELAYPDSGGITSEEGTIGFWVRTEWDAELPPDGKTLAELRTETWENRLVVRMGPTYLGLLVATADGIEQTVGSSVTWAPGEWHHVATMWGDGQMLLYIDGVRQDQRVLSGNLDIPPSTPLYVGSTRNVAAREREGTVSLRGWEVFPNRLEADEVGALLTDTAPQPEP
jgi:hypothetical protein